MVESSAGNPPHVSWVVVVPVKGTPAAKSRLGDLPDRRRLAEAFALDTVTALVGTTRVTRVFVVTTDTGIAARLESLGAVIVPELPHTPHSRMAHVSNQEICGTAARSAAPEDSLNAAIRQGTDAARARFPECHLAVVTGDLPSLTVADVEATLGLALAHERSMVPDEQGEGTTALLALVGVPIVPRYGPGSRFAHEAGGHVPLLLPSTASIRRDVDTVSDLAEAVQLGVGPYTHARQQSPKEVAPAIPTGANEGTPLE